MHVEPEEEHAVGPSGPGESHVREVDSDHLRARLEWRRRQARPRPWRRGLGGSKERVVLAPWMLLIQAEAPGELASVVVPGRLELRVDRAAESPFEVGDSPFTAQRKGNRRSPQVPQPRERVGGEPR